MKIATFDLGLRWDDPNLTPGATLRVKILALNGSLEALDGPVAEILVRRRRGDGPPAIAPKYWLCFWGCLLKMGS